MMLSMPREFLMEFVSRGAVGGRSFFARLKKTQVNDFPVDGDHRAETAAVFAFVDALKTRFTAAWGAAIPLILSMRSRAQIVPTVIRRICITVIDLMARPTSFYDQIRETVRKIQRAVDTNKRVPWGAFPSLSSAAGYVSFFGARAATNFPAEYASAAIIGKQGTYVLCAKVLARRMAACFAEFSHAILPRSFRLEAVAGVCCTCAPRIFATRF